MHIESGCHQSSVLLKPFCSQVHEKEMASVYTFCMHNFEVMWTIHHSCWLMFAKCPLLAYPKSVIFWNCSWSVAFVLWVVTLQKSTWYTSYICIWNAGTCSYLSSHGPVNYLRALLSRGMQTLPLNPRILRLSSSVTQGYAILSFDAHI